MKNLKTSKLPSVGLDSIDQYHILAGIIKEIEKRKKTYGYHPLCLACQNDCKIVNAPDLKFQCNEFSPKLNLVQRVALSKY